MEVGLNWTVRESDANWLDLHTWDIYEGKQLLWGAPRWSAPANVTIEILRKFALMNLLLNQWKLYNLMA